MKKFNIIPINNYEFSNYYIHKLIQIFIVLTIAIFPPFAILVKFQPTALHDKYLISIFLFLYSISMLLALGVIVRRRYTTIQYDQHFIFDYFSLFGFKRKNTIPHSEVVVVIVNKPHDLSRFKNKLNFDDPISVEIHYQRKGSSFKRHLPFGIISRKDLDVFLEERNLSVINKMNL